MASGHRGSTRHHAHQTVPHRRWLPTGSWALGFTRRGHLIERRNRVAECHATPDEECTCEICWRAASKHTADTPTCQCVTNATRRKTRLASNTAHTTTPLKMKQNSGDVGLQRPQQHNPGRSSGARLWADAWETEETSCGPRYGSSKEWNTVQRPGPARQSADALDKELNSATRNGRWKVDQPRQAGSLETHC
jgi:hypothetical protein